MIRRAHRFRLYPTPEQEKTLRQFVGVTRLVYNLAWEQRRDWWRHYRAATGRSFNFASQGIEVTQLRREFDFIAAVPATCLTQALRDLDKAFSNFLSGRSRFPSPRRHGVHDTFRMQAKDVATCVLNAKWSAIRIPNLGFVKYRRTRAIVGKAVAITVARDALGWHVSIACEIEHETPANDNPSVGIDRGIAVSVALSNGETFNLPDLSALDRRKRRAQRVLARRKRGSNRRRKQMRRVAALTAKIARIRAGWQHCVSRDIASRFTTVVVEDLKITNMTAAGPGKRGLNRSINNQSWGALASKLAYKLEERGGMLIKVNPAYTSQTCSDCGTVDSRSRESQARFVCRDCGFAINADTNAALNILRRSTASMPVEGSGYAPDEAGTCLEAA